MTDWNSDPELKALRDDFVLSFERRRELLAAVIQEMGRAGGAEVPAATGVALELRIIAHNLAGSAATYGFDGLGRFTGLLDDYLSLVGNVSTKRLVIFGAELDRLLKCAFDTGSDVEVDTEIFRELTSSVGSLASVAKP